MSNTQRHAFQACAAISFAAIGGNLYGMITMPNPPDKDWKAKDCQITTTAENKYTQAIRCLDGAIATNSNMNTLNVTGQTITISQDPSTGKWEIGQGSTPVDNPDLDTAWLVLALGGTCLIFCSFGIAFNPKERRHS